MRGRRLVAGGCLVSVALLAASPAAADVGVVKMSPTEAGPGSPLQVTVGCGAPHCATSIPISLVPASRAPKPHQCGGNGLCLPEVEGPPRSPPFVFLGQARESGSQPVAHRYRLRTRVPRVSPGVYAVVIYFDQGNRGPGGTLIADTSAPRRLLHVRAEQSAAASEGSGTDAVWWIGGAAGLIAVVAGALLLRRRRAG
jgi:hypothetical protein